MKKKLYIDFDGTLYNSDRLTTLFIQICEKYGLTKEDEVQAETELFDERYLFDMDKVVKYLCQKYNLPKQMLVEVEKLYNNQNIFTDIEENLTKLKESNKYEMIILTYGDISHQQKKIKASKLSKYFENIIIIDSDKSKIQNIDYKNGIFIDNNPAQIDNFIRAGAKKVIRIKRPTDKYSKFDTINKVSEYKDFTTLIDKELF